MAVAATHAALLLAQGSGRLIRTSTDRGVVAVLDPRLATAGYGPITTEIADAPPFYYAEDYHQQYLAKNPDGYCGIGGTGVSCPVGVNA